MSLREEWRWVYLLPLIHFCASIASYGLARIPGLQAFAFVLELIFWMDLPISIPVLVWNHEFLAMAWIVSAGTAWWYLVSLGIEARRKRSKNQRIPLAS